MVDESTRFDHLDGAARIAALAALQARTLVNLVVAVAIVVSWAALAAMAIGTAQVGLPAESLAGDTLLRWLPDLPIPDWAGRFLALCLTPAATSASVTASFLFMWLMWTLMAVAMMLPSAAPMIRTYCEIADTARAKGEAAVHPLILVAGYLMVWVVASAAFAAVSVLVQSRAGAPVIGYAAVAALGVAGLYQFSGLKEACLKKCRNPFAILFSRWSSRPSRIFRLGVEQGVWCLGCCWALMLVMFAVGTMNIFWMALIGAVCRGGKTNGRQVSHSACRRDTACMGNGAAINFGVEGIEDDRMADQSWAMKGELVLSCNCTVFCPCVLSLGNHPPTEGYCQTWAGFRVDSGHFGEVDLSGLNLGLIMEIPGYMSRGNWTAGLFIDKRASIYAVKGLTKIFTGKAGGTTSLLSILVGKFLGVEQVPITYETKDKTRLFQIPKIIDGAVTPIAGKDREKDTMIANSRILDRAGDHRRQGRQEPDAGLRAQLEFRRPVGRNLQARLARAVKRKKVTWPQARAFSVHLLTASGSFLAFVSLVAASEERWTAMFWWLGLALLRRRHRRADRPQA